MLGGGIVIVQRQLADFVHEFFVGGVHTPNHAHEEGKKDNQRDDGPNGHVINAAQNFFIHTVRGLLVGGSCVFYFDIAAQALDVGNQRHDFRIVIDFVTFYL